jgi:hypothetical protein
VAVGGTIILTGSEGVSRIKAKTITETMNRTGTAIAIFLAIYFNIFVIPSRETSKGGAAGYIK